MNLALFSSLPDGVAFRNEHGVTGLKQGEDIAWYVSEETEIQNIRDNGDLAGIRFAEYATSSRDAMESSEGRKRGGKLVGLELSELDMTVKYGYDYAADPLHRETCREIERRASR
jgi:hypothetical protein